MTQDQIKSNEVVKLAESRGFMAFGQNATARKHFHWFMPDSEIHGDHTFAVHQFVGHGVRELSYTVDRQGTSSAKQAIKWLMEISEVKK